MNLTCYPENTVDLRNSSMLYSYIFFPNEWMLYQIIWPLLFVFGFLNNTTFIWTVIRVPSLHTSIFIYYVTLACTDLITIIGLSLYQILQYNNSYLRQFLGVSILQVIIAVSILPAIYITCFAASTLLVTVVSFERFLAICHPIKYHIMKGTKKASKIIFVIMISSILFGIATSNVEYILANAVYCFLWPADVRFRNYPTQIIYPEMNSSIRVISEGVLVPSYFLILTIINGYLFVRIALTLRKRRLNSALRTSTQHETNMRRVANMVIVNGTAYMLCFSIVALDRVITALLDLDVIIDAKYNILWNTMSFLAIGINSSINPVIYYVTHQRYRIAFKETLSSLMRCR